MNTTAQQQHAATEGGDWSALENPLAGLAGLSVAPLSSRDPGASIASQIVPVIREAIVSGRLKGGTRLSEVQVAKHFKASRTPVREALEQLDRERLVEIAPHVGSCVKPITLRDVEEIYQIRGALERLATSLIIERLTPVGKARIEEALTNLRESARAKDSERFATARDDFHLLLIELSGNSLLEGLYQSLIGPIRRLRRIVQASDPVLSPMHRNVDIAEAILARDPGAPDLISEHLRKVAAHVTAALAAQLASS